MSIFADYQREEMPRLEPGDHRVVITNVEETTSKTSGNPMIVIEIQPNGSDMKIKNYIVKNQYFNRNMTALFDSFNIEDGDFEMLGWIGAIGAAKLAEDDQGYMKIRWFLSPEKAESLPPWQGKLPERNTVTTFDEDMLDDDEGELPFS